jgi:tyrosyl-tRNA synthetase
MTNVFDELSWRGLVYDATKGLPELLGTQSFTAYSGFDPTASSLHVGHLLPAITLTRLQQHGHIPIAVVGGGTGMIGDPSGRKDERRLLATADLEANVKGIRVQLSRMLDFERPRNPALMVNNAEWLGQCGLLDFLRETGKHFTINSMLQKQSISDRLGTEEGISFTEFSYLLLQARDFVELCDRYNCTLQIGGSDQWGNITAGIDLIRKIRGKQAHGLVVPLLTKEDGTKFGKTEEGAIWLDPERTSPFAFYQFWLNTEDSVVPTCLKFFTFLDRPAITELEATLARAPERREAQRVLAREVTRLVHGPEQTTKAERASEVLFGEDISALSVDDVLAVFRDVPSSEVAPHEIPAEGLGLVDLVARVKLAPSKSEARRLVQSGGVYVNNRRASDPRERLRRDQAIGGRLFVLRKGQKENHLVLLT